MLCLKLYRILHEASNDGDLDWTYFTLSMSWPETFCLVSCSFPPKPSLPPIPLGCQTIETYDDITVKG